MEPIRFATVGTHITNTFLTQAKKVEGFELACIHSRTQARAEEFAQMHSAKKTFTDLAEMAAWDGYDAVYIGAPIAFHYEYAKLFLEHGKHVLLEKAFTANGAQARALIDLAKSRGLLLMEAMMTTQTPNFAILRENLHKLGTIRRFTASFGGYSVRYDDHKAGMRVNTFDRSLCNGSLLDMGVYDLAPMAALFGRPEAVKAFGVVLDSGVDGQSTVICRYPGMDAVCLVTKIANTYLPCEIAGENATMTIDHIQKLSRMEIRYRDGTVDVITPPEQEHGMVYELRDFIATLRAGRTESVNQPHELTLTVMDLCDEIRRQVGVRYDCDIE